MIIEHLSAIQSTMERVNENIDEIYQALNRLRHDEIYPTAKMLAIKNGYASPALFQRILHVGYDRVARMMDVLENEKIIGPADLAKPRKVIN